MPAKWCQRWATLVFLSQLITYSNLTTFPSSFLLTIQFVSSVEPFCACACVVKWWTRSVLTGPARLPCQRLVPCCLRTARADGDEGSRGNLGNAWRTDPKHSTAFAFFVPTAVVVAFRWTVAVAAYCGPSLFLFFSWKFSKEGLPEHPLGNILLG